jgi:MFS family permease
MATRKSVMVAGIKRESAHRWKVLGVGVAANASITAAVQGIPTTAVWLLSDYHLSTAELGLAFGSIGLGLALSELPWGMLTDRWGDRPVLLTGLLSAAAMLVAIWRGSSRPPLRACRHLAGWCWQCVSSACWAAA